MFGRTRIEKLRLTAELDSTKCEQYKEDVQTITGLPIPVKNGDTYKLTYEFWIEYFGEVEKKLTSFVRLMSDPTVCVLVAAEELLHAKSVIVTVIQRIEELKALHKERVHRLEQVQADGQRPQGTGSKDSEKSS